MWSSPGTTQTVFAVLKASPGLILKSKSGKQLNSISLRIFFFFWDKVRREDKLNKIAIRGRGYFERKIKSSPIMLAPRFLHYDPS